MNVARGGNNNWDRGKVVPPYATCNVTIAVGAILWFGLGTAPMIARPWRARRAARSTAYVLTDRRALIEEPGHGKAPGISADSPEKVAGIRLVDRSGGSGDLIFQEEPVWGWSRRREAGFLGLDNVRRVEGLIHKHLGVIVERR